MGKLGCGFSIVAFLLALITALPFLGWGNCISTLPAAVLAILFSIIGLVNGEQRAVAIMGLIAGVVIFFWALFRIVIGGGLA